MKDERAVAVKEPATRPARSTGRGALERLVAIGYGLGYDAIIGGFPPYQALLAEVSACVARAGAAAAPRGVKVLDIACGTGTVAARLAREGYQVVAVDAVEHLVAVARRRHGGMSNVTFHHLDVARDPVPDAGTFDVVVSMHTLYWHPDPPGVLQASRRALRPGGHGIFLTYARPARVARTFREIRAQQGLVAAVRALRWLFPTATFEAFRRYEPQYLGREEFWRALARAGFEVLDMRATFLASLSLLAFARAGQR
ncbi:MAG: class I SAM-dependent methyltransferase [Candidatus Rokuibacteriota bacterium]